MVFPSQPIDLVNGAYFIWPINLDLDGTRLIYASAQPVACLDSGKDGIVYVFMATAGVPAEFKALRSLKFSHASLAIDAAVSGQGIALASAPLVEDDLAAGRLIRPLGFSLTDEMGLYLVYPRIPRKAAHVKWMRDWLLSQIESA